MKWQRPTVWIVAVSMLLASGLTEASQRHRWWRAGEVKTELQITDAQTAAIDQIYAENIPALKSLMAALDAEEQTLSRLIAEMNVADWELTLQIDKTEAARSALSKKRILMLYHMRQELTPEQLVKLREIEQRRRAERDRSHNCF